jgi:hypothetical protein
MRDTKVIGRRKMGKGGWTASTRLQGTMAALRRTGALVPRGVYRFLSFDEADEWMIRMTARTHVSLKSKT